MIKKILKIGGGGALIASLCCITPLFIVLFGLGSLSFALSFTKYRYLFMILGLLFVVSALFYSVKKKGKVCSINSNDIKKKKVFIVMVIASMILLYLLIQYMILPYIARIVYA